MHPLSDAERRYGYQMTADEQLDDGRPWYPMGLGTTPSLRARLQAARRVREHPNAYKHGPSDELKRRVLAVIENGKPYSETVSCEGDAESGPYALRYFGIRWGQVKLELGPNGMVYLQRVHERSGTYASRVVHDSHLYQDLWYVGFGAMVQAHLVALKSNVERNGVKFAMTGKR